MRIRLLHIIASVDPRSGGPIEGILNTTAAFEAADVEREIVSLDHPDAPYVRNCPIRVHAVGYGTGEYSSWSNPLAHYGYSKEFIPWLKKRTKEFDAVIVNGLWNYATWGASMALRNRRVPYFVYSHGMMDPWFRRQYPLKHIAKQISWLLCEGPLLSNANAVLFTTEDERQLARNVFWPSIYREAVVGYGTNEPPVPSAMQIEAFREKVPGLQNRNFLLFLSRIHPKKGCDLLIEAFAGLVQKYPELHLVIAGPDQLGTQHKLDAQASAHGIENRIHWPGMLSGSAKWGAYRAADAFILPSHQENFGIVVAEAMACGTPVLISNKVNIWREVEQSGAGFVDCDNIGGTARMMDRFYGLNQTERLRMGVSARQCFEQHFNSASTSKALINLLVQTKIAT